MFKANSAMAAEIRLSGKQSVLLAPVLSAIAQEGFVERDGCFLLSYLSGGSTNATRDKFLDRTGFECFINSMHLDDYLSRDYLLQGLMLIQAVFDSWHKKVNRPKLVAILSQDSDSTVLRFHASRPGENWLSDSLEDYEEAILMIDSATKDILGLDFSKR